jgi:ribonuclease HII
LCRFQAARVLIDRFEHERNLAERGVLSVAGVDEAGRGPLAGPVVAAAAMFPDDWIRRGVPEALASLNDSKKLTARRRDILFNVLTTNDAIVWSVAVVDAGTVDEINILQATHQAMREAVDGMKSEPTHVLVDGLPVTSLRVVSTALVKGDSLSYSIAAASVLAKVTRDRLMFDYDVQFPGYGFARHKGYGTAAHIAAIEKLGPCPIHRMSFAPLRREQEELF